MSEQPEEDTRVECRVPDCPGDILVTYAGETWCVNHAADDWLPDLVAAHHMLGCAVCGHGTIFVLRSDDTVGLHPRCVRRWVAGAVTAVPEVAMPSAPVGAYGRRRAAG